MYQEYFIYKYIYFLYYLPYRRRFFNEEASIDVTLQPLPFRADVNALPQMSLSLGMMMVINFSFIFSNVWMDIIISHIMDHHFRKQQALTGMSLSIYCFCMCVFDFIRVIILTLLIVMVVSIYLNPRHDVQLYSQYTYSIFSALVVSPLI